MTVLRATKNQESLLMLSPKYFPLSDGLGHYTKILTEYLSKEFDMSIICSNNCLPDNGLEGVKHPLFLSSWKFFGWISILFYVVLKKPKYILLQYVPFMYSKKGGINFFVPLFIILLKIFSNETKFAVMLHELWYPNEPSFKSKILHYLHKLQLCLMLPVFSKIFTSTKSNFQEIKSLLPVVKDRIVFLPVASNIKTPKKRNFSFRNRSHLVHFGSLHISRNAEELVIKINHLLQDFPGVTLSYIGGEFFSPDIKDKLSSQIIYLGKLSDNEINQIFSQSDLLLAFYSDGVSARRGSILAALDHGLPVLTVLGHQTDDLFKTSPVYLTSDNVDDFIISLKKFLECNLQLQDPKEIVHFYQNNFGWDLIVKTLSIELRSL